MKPLGKMVYGSYYLISPLDSKSTGWHEIVLYVDYDERVRVLHSDVLGEVQFIEFH
jgi:hypothetical protein